MPDTSPTCWTCRDLWTDEHVCTSGADLAKERTSAGLTKAETARRMNVTKQYLGRIELQPHPTADIKTRYRAALKLPVDK